MISIFIIELSKEQFDRFSKAHPLRSYYQTSAYGMLMNREGYDTLYVGLINHDMIIAASLILVKSLFANYKYAYAPRGFLIDYNNLELLNLFTKELKTFLLKKKVINIKLDPPVQLQLYDQRQKIIPNTSRVDIVNYLKRIGYLYGGLNLNFEALKPRYNAIINVETTSKLFNSFSKEVRNKIRSALRKNVSIYIGDKSDINIFYDFIKKKTSKKELYYENMYDIFNTLDMMDIWFAKIEPNKYISNYRTLYDLEVVNNTRLNKEMTSNGSNTSLYNQKMASDKLLDTYMNNIVLATKLAHQYPQGLILGTCGVIKNDREISIIIDGYQPQYKSFNTSQLLKWEVIKYYTDKGYKIINLNGITGDFNNSSNKFYGLNQHKLAFNADIIEYIGEFNLIINKNIYYIYNKLRPLKKIFKNSNK